MLPPLTEIIDAIEIFRTRIGMYIYPIDVPNTYSFLRGLVLGVHFCGIKRDADLWWKVQETRGWERMAVGPVPQMEKRGMNVRQVIDELIDIEIETLRQSNPASSQPVTTKTPVQG